jgi:hypothetical protein
MMGPPFIAMVLFDELALDTSAWPVQVTLAGVAILGGLAGALLQAQALREHVARPLLWIGATALYWGLALAASPLLGLIGTAVIVALVSGLLFVWLLRGWGLPRDPGGDQPPLPREPSPTEAVADKGAAVSERMCSIGAR